MVSTHKSDFFFCVVKGKRTFFFFCLSHSQTYGMQQLNAYWSAPINQTSFFVLLKGKKKKKSSFLSFPLSDIEIFIQLNRVGGLCIHAEVCLLCHSQRSLPFTLLHSAFRHKPPLLLARPVWFKQSFIYIHENMDNQNHSMSIYGKCL